MQKRDKLILLFLFGTNYGGVAFCLAIIGMLKWLFIITFISLVIRWMYIAAEIFNQIDNQNI